MSMRLINQELDPFRQFLDKYFRAYQSLHIEQIRKFWNQTDGHSWGTGSDDQYVTLDQITNGYVRDFSEVLRLELDYDALTVFRQGSAACAAGLLNLSYSLRQDSKGLHHMPLLRFTLYLEWIESRWQIIHAHTSAGLREQGKGHSFPP